MRIPPVRRLFLSLFHLSWPVQALLVCTAFLLGGTAIAGDYPVRWDTLGQQLIAERNLAYIMGATDRLDGFWVPHDKYYGIAFDLPLFLLERGLGLEDPRHVYLLRYLMTHGFFLVGGFCCSLLVYRLSNNRGLALVALLLFVVQPRLYAHSFFNSKDLPFLSMFMVTLYLTHRAFRTETIRAFVLCGVSVGILTNLRIMGVMLFPAVLALRGLDLVEAGRRGEGRKPVLMTGAAFALAGPGTLYALSPYLWPNPVELVTAVQTLAQHPTRPAELFQGSLIDPHHLPWHYIPTWMGISTPPVTLMCGVLGVIVVGVRSLRAPRAALGNTDLRFGLLLAACLTLPVVAIVVLGAHMYNGWRHVYFLHAPLSCLAALGVQWAGGNAPARVAVVSALVGLSVLVTGGEMVRLHPYQHVYFNALVDRTTPESLRISYRLDSEGGACREGLEFLRRRYPATTVSVKASPKVARGWRFLPHADRMWLKLAERNSDVQVRCGGWLQIQIDRWSPAGLFKADGQIRKELSLENVLYVRKVYDSTILIVQALMTVPDREQSEAYRTESHRGIRSGQLVQQGEFDLYRYRHSRRLGYAKDGCTASDREAPFFLHVVPVEEADLPASRRRYGFDNLDFVFLETGRWTDDKCWTTVVLPDYPVSRIRTGQYTKSGRIWETDLSGQFLDSDTVSLERGNGNDETPKPRSRHSPPPSYH